MQSWTSAGYSSNSTGSFVTNCRFSPIIGGVLPHRSQRETRPVGIWRCRGAFRSRQLAASLEQSADNLELWMNREICRALLHGDHLSLPPFRFDDALLSRHTTNKSGELAEAAPGVREILFLAQPGRASPHLVRGFEPGTNHRALSTRSRVGFLWKAGMTRGNNLKVAAGVLLEIAQVPRTGSRWPIWPWKLLCRLKLATGACRYLYVIKWMPSRNLASRTRLQVGGGWVSFINMARRSDCQGWAGDIGWCSHSKVLFEGLRICFSSTGAALDH